MEEKNYKKIYNDIFSKNMEEIKEKMKKYDPNNGEEHDYVKEREEMLEITKELDNMLKIFEEAIDKK